MSDQDSPWKEVQDHFFMWCLRFFHPEAHAAIDWSKDPETLETEMRKLVAESEFGLRRLDKLVKVFKRDGGDEAFLHVEAQMRPEDGFEKRVYDYNSVAELRYNHPIVSIAVLGDERIDWRPAVYEFCQWGTRKRFEYVVVKLLDWRGKEDELEADENPFALFVLAHLQAQATRNDEEARAQWKVRIANNLCQRPMLEIDRQQWLRLIDWLLELPAARNAMVWQEIAAFSREKNMPFVSYLEQKEMDARREGEREGEREGLLLGIESLLEVKFGAEGLALFPQVHQVFDLEFLRKFMVSIRQGMSLDELRKLLP